MAENSVVSSFQPSLTEWFGQFHHPSKTDMQEEDVKKRDRLAALSRIIGLDYDHVWTFSAVEVFSRAPATETFFKEHAKDLCALRLVPKDPALPKLRTRGRTLEASLSWLYEQKIDPALYNVEVVEHNDVAEYSTIFVVRNDGIFGHVVTGLHHQLTQGDVTGGSWTFQVSPEGTYRWSSRDANVETHVKNILASLLVDDREIQESLRRELSAEFSPSGHMLGYFETLLWPGRLIFIDYNRLLHEMLVPVAPVVEETLGTLSGQCGSAGHIVGRARVIAPEAIEQTRMEEGDILVTQNTDVRFLPLMQKASAVLTEKGGILSHAAIVCRELGLPAVVGIRGLLEHVHDGDKLEVDAGRGHVALV
ncbi:hypothetical protein HYW18_03555 [Candidatus Uhrbacteria bacterium]|nr:hypothetical protein [Candidatus Uhrbacteria bacterium]